MISELNKAVKFIRDDIIAKHIAYTTSFSGGPFTKADLGIVNFKLIFLNFNKMQISQTFNKNDIIES